MFHQSDRSFRAQLKHTFFSAAVKPMRLLSSGVLSGVLAVFFLALAFAWLSVVPSTAQARAIIQPFEKLTDVPASPLAATLMVTNTNDSGAGSLRAALVAAAAGDTIQFSLPANSIITLTSELTVLQAITINGATAINLSVSGNNATRVFSVTAPATFIRFTIMKGNATGNGGGLHSTGALTLTAMQVMSNTSSLYGGGVYATDAATLIGGLFQNNIISGFYGGGLYANSTLVLTGTQFLSNTVPHGDGGGVYAFGAATLNGGLFQNNTSPGFSGGGIYASNAIALTGTQFLSNSSGDGGGVYANGAATLSGGTFQNNSAGYGGGGLWVTGAATLNGGLFQNNRASIGGGLYAYSTLALTGTQFISNTGARGGGISYSLFGSGNYGRIVNALFARNVATSTLGAAVYLYTPGSGSVQILHTTIASPTLGSGSAIYIATGTVGITDTIISNYSIGISRTNGAVYENYNLFSGTTISRSGSFVASSGTNDVIGDPKFADPASDNYHLRFGSAAIDTGIDVSVTTDIDGQARPFNGLFDIGYDEFVIYNIYLPLALKNF